MIQGNVQYVADTLLLEKIFLIDAGLQKQADFGGFLSGVADTIMDWGRAHIDTSSVGSVIGSLADILVPGVLFKIHPALGALGVVAQILGFNPSSIVTKIMALVQGKLENGQAVTAEEVSAAGKAALAGEAGSIEATADCFDYLRQFEKRGELVRFIKQSQFLGFKEKSNSYPDIPLLPDRNAPLLTRVFGNLLQTRKHGKAKWLLGGFVIWIVKTLLLGAGLLAGGEVIKGLLMKNTPVPEVIEQTIQSEPETATTPASIMTFSPASNLKPSGRGEDYHKNDGRSLWMVPVVGGSVENTLLAWAVDVYPELAGQEEKIISHPSFNKTVNQMKEDYKLGAKELAVPGKFKTRKQVVDQFATQI